MSLFYFYIINNKFFFLLLFFPPENINFYAKDSLFFSFSTNNQKLSNICLTLSGCCNFSSFLYQFFLHKGLRSYTSLFLFPVITKNKIKNEVIKFLIIFIVTELKRNKLLVFNRSVFFYFFVTSSFFFYGVCNRTISN